MSRKRKARSEQKKCQDAGRRPGRPTPLCDSLLPECPDWFREEAEGFLGAILADPLDDLPRLVFADRLDELETPADRERMAPRSELIRVGVELNALLPPDQPPTTEGHGMHAPGNDSQHAPRTRFLEQDGPPWASDPRLRSLAERETDLLKRVCRSAGYLVPPDGTRKWKGGWEVQSHLGTVFTPRNVTEDCPAVLNCRGLPGVLWCPLGEWLGHPGRAFPLPCTRWEVPEFEPAAVRFRDDAGFSLTGPGQEVAYREPGQARGEGRVWWAFVATPLDLGEPGWEPYMLPPKLLAAVARSQGIPSGHADEWRLRWTPDKVLLAGAIERQEYRRADGTLLTMNPQDAAPGLGVMLTQEPAAVVFATRDAARFALAAVLGEVLMTCGRPDSNWWEWFNPVLPRSEVWHAAVRCRGSLTRVSGLWDDAARGGAYFPPAVLPPGEVDRAVNPFGLTSAPDVDRVVTLHHAPDWPDEDEDDYDTLGDILGTPEPHLGEPADDHE